MDEQLFELLEQLIEGRNRFFCRSLQQTPHAQRFAMGSRFMLNEICYLELLGRIYQNSSRTQSTVLTVTIPTNFEDDVPITPSQEQITASVENIEPSTSNCAICQEVVSSGACKIRQCGHIYHRSCLLNWFAINPRCPVCRHDIRQVALEGSEDQTQTDEE